MSLPVPENYVGPQKIFSPSAEDEYPVIKELTPDIDNSIEWIPRRHRRDHVPKYRGDEKIPPCLERAVKSFLISVAVRDLRGYQHKHNSMLIHVTRFNEVQEKVHEQVLDYVEEIKSRASFESGASLSIWDELEDLWNIDYVPTSKAILKKVDQSWNDIKSQVFVVLDRLEVKTINGSSNDGLEYLREDYPECVIAIGGDKLSRGLTLEGLSVSYFLRQSRMYDTLMQMGRWFGHRPGYEDLCRLFTNSSLVANFQSILMATEELTEELIQMSNLKMSPKDFGLKVKVSPGLLVTNRLKMRDTIEVDISFGSGVAESTALAQKDVQGNWASLNKFLLECEKHDFFEEKSIKSKYLQRNWEDILLYENISGFSVANFLSEFKTHETSRSVIPEILAKYITEQLSSEELINWTVVVHSGDGSVVNFQSGKNISMSQRKTLTIDEDKITFRRLASKNDEFIDIPGDIIDEKFGFWKSRDEEIGRLKDVHSRMMRDKKNGLIMFYIIEPLDSDRNVIKLENPLVGFMVSFSRSENGKTVRYRVNNVWANENMV